MALGSPERGVEDGCERGEVESCPPRRPRASGVMMRTCRGKIVPVRPRLGPVHTFSTFRQEGYHSYLQCACLCAQRRKQAGCSPYLSPSIRIGGQAQSAALYLVFCNPLPTVYSCWAGCPGCPVGKGQFRALLRIHFPKVRLLAQCWGGGEKSPLPCR